MGSSGLARRDGGSPSAAKHVQIGRLTNMAADYRRRYGKAGFAFEVWKLPDEDVVGAVDGVTAGNWIIGLNRVDWPT